MSKKAIILRWLPGSGKSTRSKQQKGYQIISRDVLRLENPTFKEHQIIDLQNKLISEATCDIIIDDTNMNPKTLQRLSWLCRENWYTVEIKDMYYEMYKQQTPLLLEAYRHECHRRNKEREKYVPWSVIDKMFLMNYPILNPFDKWTVIVDIDWTLANIDHRLHYMEWKKNRMWFFKEMSKDTVYEPVRQVVNKLHETHPIVIMSWRPDTYYKQTETRLKNNWIKYHYILMRSWYDSRPDTDVKRDLYDFCLANNWVAMAFDDRPCIVSLWRSKWIYTFDCNQTWRDF